MRYIFWLVRHLWTVRPLMELMRRSIEESKDRMLTDSEIDGIGYQASEFTKRMVRKGRYE